jgi:hypothetical protein
LHIILAGLEPWVGRTSTQGLPFATGLALIVLGKVVTKSQDGGGQMDDLDHAVQDSKFISKARFPLSSSNRCNNRAARKALGAHAPIEHLISLVDAAAGRAEMQYRADTCVACRAASYRNVNNLGALCGVCMRRVPPVESPCSIQRVCRCSLFVKSEVESGTSGVVVGRETS